MLRLICAFALLLAISPLYAEDTGRELAEARNIFLQGVDGDRHAVLEATNRFRTLSRSHPNDPVYLAYFGACLSLEGRDAPTSFNKKQFTEEGLEDIDQALKLLPADDDKNFVGILDAKLVAANTFIHMPAFFNRQARGKQLLSEILAHRDFDKMAPGFKAAAYMAAALVAHGEGDDKEYRRYLDLTVKADPDGRDGRLASKLQIE